MGGIKNKSLSNNKVANLTPLLGELSRAKRVTEGLKYLGVCTLTLSLVFVISINLYRTYSSSSAQSNAEPVSNGSIYTLANTANTELDPTGISISISSYPSSSSTGGNGPNLSLSIPQGGGIATGRHTVEVNVGSSVASYELRLSSKTDETALVNEGISNLSNARIEPIAGKYNASGETGLRNILASESNNTWAYAIDAHSVAGVIETGYVAPLPSTNTPDIMLSNNGNNSTTTNIYYGAKVEHPEQLLAGDYTADVVYSVVAELMPAPTVTDLVLNSSWTDNTPDTAYGSTSILTGENLNSVTGVYIDLNGNTVKDDGEAVANLTHATGNEANTKLTFEAPTYTEEGQKNVYLEWPGGEPVKIENGWNYIESSVCNSLDANSNCIVDIDDNMVSVYYTGDENNPEWSVAPDCTDVTGKRQCGWSQWGEQATINHGGDWYDYLAGKWANAVTLRDDFSKGCYEKSRISNDEFIVWRISSEDECNKLGSDALSPKEAAIEAGKWVARMGWANYSPNPYESDRFSLHPDDILGYWVYIPRYSYEVMRRDAIDLVQQPEDFKIKFETADTTKKVPVEGCSDANNPKSYRVGCSLNRTYTNTATNTETNTVTNTTWATHPAFTWMDENGNPVELNGIWVGKFETTGSTEQPTVLPNQKHMSQYPGNIGDMYDVAKSMGASDPNNKYGNTTSTNQSNQNNNNLAISTSHMLKNSEWGAVTYLASSKYGAGINQVFNNSQYQSGRDGNGDSSYGVTGCGPINKDNINAGGTYTGDDSALGTSAACHGSSNPEYAYNGEIGKLASTTNNVYGVYDMAGGAYEYAMGGYTTDASQSYPSNSYITNKVKPPYVDLYVNPPFTGTNYTNNNLCTWATCGGHALYETKNVQSVSSNSRSWGGDYSNFVYVGYPWFLRGGYAYDGSYAGLFCSDYNDGGSYVISGFRVALIAN